MSFTAIVKVQRVTKKSISSPNLRAPSTEASESRDISEVVTLTIRADSIEALKKKLIAHVELIEDFNGD